MLILSVSIQIVQNDDGSPHVCSHFSFSLSVYQIFQVILIDELEEKKRILLIEIYSKTEKM